MWLWCPGSLHLALSARALRFGRETRRSRNGQQVLMWTFPPVSWYFFTVPGSRLATTQREFEGPNGQPNSSLELIGEQNTLQRRAGPFRWSETGRRPALKAH